MKSFILLLSLTMLLFPSEISSQSLIRCTDKITYWVIPDNEEDIAVKLKGDIDLSIQPDILNVNEIALQYVLLDKNRYSKENCNTDKSTLKEYVEFEVNYLKIRFNTPSLYSENEELILSSGKNCIIWYFLLPEERNNGVTAQIFAAIVINNKIFALGSPVFEDEDLNKRKEFLIETINNSTKITDTKKLCN